MRNVKWLMAAGLVTLTAGCVETTTSGYPSTSYNRGYSNNGYYANNGQYYSNSNAGYASTAARRGPNGDYDRDGIPNRYDRDANGDGVPDRYQR